MYCARADAIPHLLEEIGRLRELTFRAAGEGTGRARDLDSFDEHYEHLFLWNRRREEVVGAYRLGRVDEIRKRAGRRGLYTAGAVPLSRSVLSVVRPGARARPLVRAARAQRSFAPLLTLWKGIGEYLARHPRYLRLLGPVSISNDYRELSRQLLVEFLRSHCLDPLLAQFVRPAHPVPRGRMVRTLAAEVSMLGHLDALAALVEDIEPDGKGVPVLLRQYLKLGGRMLAFNVDPAFNHSIDCLLMVDLRQTDPRVLRKYLPEARRRAHRRDEPALLRTSQSRLTRDRVSYVRLPISSCAATGFNIPSMNCHLRLLPWRPSRRCGTITTLHPRRWDER